MNNKLMAYFEKKKCTFLLLAIVGVLVDIFIFRFTSDLVILGLTGMWIGAVIGWRLEGRFSILGALIFLTMCPFLLILKKDPIAEKAAIWAYMFLVVGVIQQLIELKKEPEGWRDFDDFLRNIKKLTNSKINELKREGVGKTLLALIMALPVAGQIWWQERRRRLAANWWIRKTGLLGRLLLQLFALWPELTLLGLLALIIRGLIKEINFYCWFFEGQWWWQFAWRLLPLLLLFWGLLWQIWGKINGKLQLPWRQKFWLGIFFCLIIWRGDSWLFRQRRQPFENKPYILRLEPSLATGYMKVKIFGRNFNQPPFKPQVFLNGRQQRVLSWGKQLVIVEIDPYRAESGPLWVRAWWAGHWQQSNRRYLRYYDPRRATPRQRRQFWRFLEQQARQTKYKH